MLKMGLDRGRSHGRCALHCSAVLTSHLGCGFPVPSARDCLSNLISVKFIVELRLGTVISMLNTNRRSLATRVTLLVSILVIGAASGYGAARLYRLTRTHHVLGDYSAYFQSGAIRVIVFGTSDCSFCRQTRAYLDKRGVPYSFADVRASAEAAAQHAQLGGGGVPAILVADRRIQGFWPDEIDEALAR